MWIEGTMDNTDRTYNFTADTGSLYLNNGNVGKSLGRIVGGTLFMSGPNARLDFNSNAGGGMLDGVTINGDIALGGFREVGFGGTSSDRYGSSTG